MKTHGPDATETHRSRLPHAQGLRRIGARYFALGNRLERQRPADRNPFLATVKQWGNWILEEARKGLERL